MKKPALNLTLIAAATAVVCLLIPSVVRAADKDDGKKSKRDAEMIKKYDKNGNGKLDPDEEAAMKADQAKAKNEREREKKKK